MSAIHHKETDIRPKRRRSKDNPYRLYTIGLRTDSPQYYVSFHTENEGQVCLEVERSVFEAMDRFELDDLHYLNEMDNHYERSELTEASLAARMSQKPENLEDMILRNLLKENLRKMISKLPLQQRRRLTLYYYGNLTYKQIAEMENCSDVAIKKSVDTAKKNIREMLLEG